MSNEEVVTAIRATAKQAVDTIGGPADTARKLKELLIEAGRDDEARKMRIGKVWSWVNRDKSGIPVPFIELMEKLSGIPREELRPDIPWR